MTRSEATSGTLFTGKCVVCGTKYSYIETARGAHNGFMPNRPYCGCRDGIPCDDWRCGLTSRMNPREPHNHQATAIKFKAVKVTLSDKKCTAACQNGVSHYCNCSCGGTNHGLANRIPPRTDRKA